MHEPTDRADLPTIKKSFFVDQKLLFKNSEYLKEKIFKQDDKKKLKIHSTHLDDFACYLDWIHDRILTAEGIKNRSVCLLQQPDGNDSDDGNKMVVVLGCCKTGAAVLKLCKLLRMNVIHLDDDGFKAQVLERLEDCTRGVLIDNIRLSLNDGQELWCFALHKLGTSWALPKRNASLLRAKIPGWMSTRLNREQIEERGTTMDEELLEALRKLVPFTTIKIRIGNAWDEKTVLVNRSLAIQRSTIIAERIANTSDILVRDCHKEISIDAASGELRVSGQHEPRTLEDWAQSLVAEKGMELNHIINERYPFKDRNPSEACGFKTSLCKMWILAESLGDFMIQRLILEALIKYSGGHECLDKSLTWPTVALVAEKLPHDSGLRRLVVDIIAAHIDVVELRDVGDKVDPRILVDLLEKEKKGEPNKHRKPKIEDLEKYCAAS